MEMLTRHDDELSANAMYKAICDMLDRDRKVLLEILSDPSDETRKRFLRGVLTEARQGRQVA
jgi:hypothetical protein